jgi:hypothetical protein
MVRVAGAVVVCESTPFGLEALDVGKGAGVELESEDFGVETLGAVAQEVLLELNESE